MPTITVTSGSANGSNDDDIITGIAQPGTGQIHIYASGGNDTVNLSFSSITRFSHGHHARGDRNNNVSGSDTFNFINTSNVSNGATVVGRLEDFDYSRDVITIDGVLLDLYNLPSNVRIVEFNGEHNDPGSYSQQWLLISTSSGGYIFYSLEGARVDMNGDGGSNSGYMESHFISQSSLPDFSSLVDVTYIDPQNYIPAGYVRSDNNGLIIYDDDVSGNTHPLYPSNVLSPINGSDFGDLISAGLNDDIVVALGGDDISWGGSGHDSIYGGSGNDTIFGNTGNDLLNGGSGADVLDGGSGIDVVDYTGSATGIVVSLESPSVNTGDAAGDIFIGIENINGSSFNDTLTGDTGRNEILGGNGSDLINGRSGADTLYGEAGNDSLIGGAGADAIYGGDGSDLAIYWDATSGIRVDLLSSSVNTGIAAGDSYSSIEHFTGGNFDDTLAGDNGNNSILAYAGNDSILGRDGNDTLNGGDGNDTLLGGSGSDFLAGGNGIDLAAYWDTTTSLRVDLLNAGTNTGIATGDTYSSIENFTGGNLGDTLFGDNSDNYILGYAGDDVMAGRDGNDILQGGVGLDLLIGGAGRDYLYGGAGDGVRDTFRFDAVSESAVGANRDVIYDFVSGIDKIDLRTIDANSALPADQAFVFAGSTATANAIWYTTSGGNVIISGDVNGDSVADFEILVASISSLSSIDFLL